VAAVYGILVGLFVYRNLTLMDLYSLLVDTAVASAVIMVIVMNASVFAWMLTTGRVAQSLFQIVTAVTTDYVLVLIALNVFLLVAGCFMDAISAYYIFIPLFMPICVKLGVDPVHLGIIMTTNLAIGLITPPVGVDLYTASAISGVPFKDICREVWPFVIPAVFSLVLITYIPAISLWLPRVLGMR
jgi:C4-dicarboxylate transporter DctM subunit